MTGMKKFLTRVFYIIVLQGLITSTFFAPHAVDFLDGRGPRDAPVLRWDTRIPVGIVGKTVHHITLPKGTSFSEIPLQISKKREEIGLSSNIPQDEQSGFFQNLTWETAKAVLVKSPTPGRVVHINVRQGQRIMAGDFLGTLECMKMYINISAGSHGEIRDIFFQVGDIVNYGSDLIRILPTSPDWEGIGQEKILENKDFLILLFPWATRTPPKGIAQKRTWKSMRQPEILNGKDYMVFLYPWMVNTPPTPANPPPPHKGAKSNFLSTFSGNENNQQALPPPKAIPSGIQNSMMDHSDQNHKISRNNTKSTYEKAGRHSSIWQGKSAPFHQQGMHRDEFKDTSGISTAACIQWFCGLVVLSKLAFALKLLCCNLLRRVRLKKYAFIVSTFPKTAYLYIGDCNKYQTVKNKRAPNRNRRYFVKWRAAS